MQRGEDHPFSAFNAKNFATSISPWVVTLDALEPFRVKPHPRDDRDLLSYLNDPADSTYDINVRLEWKLVETGDTFEISNSCLRNAYWTFKQMVSTYILSWCLERYFNCLGTAYFPNHIWLSSSLGGSDWNWDLVRRGSGFHLTRRVSLALIMN